MRAALPLPKSPRMTSPPTIKLKTSANLDTHREVMIFKDSPSSPFADGSVFKEDNSNSVNHSHSSSGKLVPLIAVIGLLTDHSDDYLTTPSSCLSVECHIPLYQEV
ncbi:unnamed protein product [Lepeophtheirus salmonis]|uniref:(salmon louse) hypothetical protein n=1 Tax=Lepeophtheirus salmonis TaxID=72036 RepID=A0A817FDE8_LEPSM|nr:unnamed protein product [Lepeophtheirus salmonis]